MILVIGRGLGLAMYHGHEKRRRWDGAGGGGGDRGDRGDRDAHVYEGSGYGVATGDHEGNEEPLVREEKRFSQRSRLFVGNLPSDMKEDELRSLFTPFGAVGEVFCSSGRGFGFVCLERRFNAELAKAELDGSDMRGRNLRVRFALQGTRIKVRNLHPTVSNELLEAAFSVFGEVERAVVVCDERGRTTGRGIVQFANRQVAKAAIDRCTHSHYLLTTSIQPVIVEMEEEADEDGVPEKVLMRHPLYSRERELPPRFAEPSSLDYQLALQWKNLFVNESQRLNALSDASRAAHEQLMADLAGARLEHQAQLLRQELMQREEDLRRFELHLHHRRMEGERRKQEDMKTYPRVESEQKHHFSQMQAPEQPPIPPATVAAVSQATTISSQQPSFYNYQVPPPNTAPPTEDQQSKRGRY
uniref:splicing factor, proline- and glutamine-rich-like isoform X1 n=2 Tax=Myxine glutinosa TaxID=7769 RepID=UPI00358E5D82